VPGKESNGNQVPFRGRHNQLDHKSLQNPSANQSRRDGRIRSPARECRERKATETKSPLGDGTTNLTTNPFKTLPQTSPGGTEESRARHGSAGKGSNGNQVPFRGRHNQLDHKSLQNPSANQSRKGRKNPEPGTGVPGKEATETKSPLGDGTTNLTTNPFKTLPQTSPGRDGRIRSPARECRERKQRKPSPL